MNRASKKGAMMEDAYIIPARITMIAAKITNGDVLLDDEGLLFILIINFKRTKATVSCGY